MVNDHAQGSSRTASEIRPFSGTDAQPPATLGFLTEFSPQEPLRPNPNDLSLGVHLQHVPLDQEDAIQEITVYTNNFSAARTDENVASFLRSLQEIQNTPSPSMKTFEAKTKDLIHQSKVFKSGFSAHLLNTAQSIQAEKSTGVRRICLGNWTAESVGYKSLQSAAAPAPPPAATSDSDSDSDPNHMLTKFKDRSLDLEVDGCLTAL
jgi:hypothetical protein